MTRDRCRDSPLPPTNQDLVWAALLVSGLFGEALERLITFYCGQHCPTLRFTSVPNNESPCHVFQGQQ